MINNFINIFFEIKYPIFGLLIFLISLSFFWSSIFNFLNLKPYVNIQRIHKNEVSRLGGLVIYIFLWVTIIFGFLKNNLLYNILVSSIPLALISIKEDISHNTMPSVRLGLMLVSCLIFFYLDSTSFPSIEIPFLKNLIAIYPISIIFFSFSTLVMINGMNLIDGINGLFCFTAISQLGALIYFSLIYDNPQVLITSIVLVIPLMLFLLFNFPFGKIFIGDLGAYFYGFSISLITIIFFAANADIITWKAVLLLFYPCTEVLISFIRKFKDKISPFSPDKNHLHSILFIYLINKSYTQELSSLFAIFIMSFFWCLPVVLCLISSDIYTVSFSLFISFIMYLCFYYILREKVKY